MSDSPERGMTARWSNDSGVESGLNILLLEDDEQLRSALESLLEDEGYQVATAGDGRQAVAQAAEVAPDILILDVKLPGPDGLEVLQQLKQQLPELQSLVMTGYASEEDSIRAIRLGVGDYLQKPFPMVDFLNAVESLTKRAVRQRRLTEKETALDEVTRWGLEFLTSSVDLASPPKGRTRRWAGEVAEGAARRLGFSQEACRAIGPAVLFSLLRADQQDNERLGSLEKLLSEPVVHLSESLSTALEEANYNLAEPPALVNLGLYLIHQVTEKTTGEVHQDLQQCLQNLEEQPEDSTRPHRRSEFAILGLARTLFLSGDSEGAKAALERLTKSDQASRVAGEALLLAAQIEPAQVRANLKKLLGWLPKLAPLEGAELQFKAGLVAVERGLDEGKTLLQRSVKTYQKLGLAGELATAELALWTQKETDEFQPQLELLLAPHRGDLLLQAAPWLLEPLLANIQVPQAQRAALRIVRESPKAVYSAGKTEETALGLLHCFEQLEGGPEEVVRKFCSPEFGSEVTERARALLSKGNQRPLLRLLSFGAFEVHIGDTVLAGSGWAPQKARFLLACLGHTRRPTPQELLVEQFWPDSAPGRGLKNLYQALTDIRQAVDPLPDPIEREGSLLKVSEDYPFWSDVEEFESALDESRKTNDPQAARELMYDALRLYRGPFLEDCPLEWAETQRRDLELKHTQLLEKLMDCCHHLGRHREVVSLCSQLLDQDRCHQTANQLLMEAHIALGRPEEAVRQYQRAEAALANEFGMEPSIELFKSLQKAKLAM